MHDHANEWHRFEVYCKDFYVAGRYAAERGWWLHCWDWYERDEPYITVHDTWADTWEIILVDSGSRPTSPR